MEEAAEGLLGRAALSAGDGAAQLSEAGLELNTSALQSLATSLTSLGTLIKIPPPVRLLHFFWHLKIWKSHRDKWVMPRRCGAGPLQRDRAVPGAAVERVTHLHPCLGQQFQLIPVASWAHWPCFLLLDSKDGFLVCSSILRDKFGGCGELWEAKIISACIKMTSTMPN